MTNLKRLFSQPLRPLPNKVVVLFLVLALIGFCDASYLTFEHFINAIPPCTTGGCETVLTSKFSMTFGIPDPLLGAIYYLCLLVGAAAYLEGKREKIFRYALFLTIAGLLMSIWLVSVMAFILHSYCTYCLGSAATSTLLFITAAVIFSKYRSTDTLTA